MELIQMIGDIVAICMCAVTVFLLFRQHAKYRANPSEHTGSSGNFNEQLTHLVGAGATVDPSHANDGGRKGRTAERETKEDDSGWDRGPAPVRDSRRSQRGKSEPDETPCVDPYGEVKRLADMGVDQEEICKRVGMPKGEIELILKLSSLSAGFRED